MKRSWQIDVAILIGFSLALAEIRLRLSGSVIGELLPFSVSFLIFLSWPLGKADRHAKRDLLTEIDAANGKWRPKLLMLQHLISLFLLSQDGYINFVSMENEFSRETSIVVTSIIWASLMICACKVADHLNMRD